MGRRENHLVKRASDLCAAPHEALTTASQPTDLSRATRTEHSSSRVPTPRRDAPTHEGEDADGTHDNTQRKTWRLEAQFDAVRPCAHA